MVNILVFVVVVALSIPTDQRFDQISMWLLQDYMAPCQHTELDFLHTALSKNHLANPPIEFDDGLWSNSTVDRT